MHPTALSLDCPWPLLLRILAFDCRHYTTEPGQSQYQGSGQPQNFLLQPLDNALFQPGDIGLGNTDGICHLLLGVFGAALATLIAQGISAVFSLLIFFSRMRRYKSPFNWFDRQELASMLQIAVPSVLQQSTVSIGMMIVQAVVNPFGTQALAGYAATMRVENVFSLIFVSIGNAVSPYVSQNYGARKIERIKKGYHAALVLDVCFAVLAFVVIETLHTQISSLFLGKDGTALAYQVSGDYMRWLGYFFIFMGIKMATDGVLRGLGIMRPFLIANMVNLAIRLSVALIFAPRFGIAFVWLAVPAGWFANFLISYVALRKSWRIQLKLYSN